MWEAVLIRSGHFVQAAVGRGRLLVVVCFQERGEIRVSPRLLPPGKPSVAVGVPRSRDAEDSDAQVGGDLEAHARTVARQIHQREDLKTDGVDGTKIYCTTTALMKKWRIRSSSKEQDEARWNE